MKLNDSRYDRHHLIKEMYEVVDYIKNFEPVNVNDFIGSVPDNTPLMLTGEGSSRIFPAKNAVHRRLLSDRGPLIFTEGSTDLDGKNLDNFVVIGASNSGKTKELVHLFRKLQNSGHKQLYGLTCNYNSTLENCSKKTVVIDVGPEKAVAATKSVIGQALFYDSLMSKWYDNKILDKNLLADNFLETLNSSVDSSVIEMICKAETVYYTGNNNGAAEELTLKTNEIIRKKSSFLPGTYLLHGVEEVISGNDIIIMVDAYPDEYEKIKEVYSKNIGTPVIAIATEPSPFNSIIIPSLPDFYEPYIKLAAGWNLLVETGLELGIDLDKPQRARKIGNEAIS